MKTLQKKDLEILAEKFHAELEISHPFVSLIFVDEKGFEYGFESAEFDNENYYGFKFFGEASKQAELIELWNSLTVVRVEKQLLTIELAKLLIGKAIRVSWCDTNEGEAIIKINSFEKKEEKQIGQSSHLVIVHDEFEGDNKKSNNKYFYEWQGIFRRGSGAERLFVEEIFN